MHTTGVTPDSKVHVTNMGPIWGRQDPGGPHVGPMNLAIWDIIGCGSLWSVCQIFCDTYTPYDDGGQSPIYWDDLA